MKNARPVTQQDVTNATNKFMEVCATYMALVQDKRIPEEVKDKASKKANGEFEQLLKALEKIQNGKDCFREFNEHLKIILSVVKKLESTRGWREYKVPFERTKDADIWGFGRNI